MKKIIEKIKRILIIVLNFIILVPYKVLAMSNDILNSNITSTFRATDYGAEAPDYHKIIIRPLISMLKILLIPLVLLMGLIIFIKKTKNEKARMIEKIILETLVIIFVGFLILFFIMIII